MAGNLPPNPSLATQQSLGRKRTVPELKPNTTITGVLTYTVAEDQDEKLAGAHGRIHKVTNDDGKFVYAVKTQKLIGRSDVQREADIYFAIKPEECPHLALLSDVVLHPERRDVPSCATHSWRSAAMTFELCRSIASAASIDVPCSSSNSSVLYVRLRSRLTIVMARQDSRAV